MYLLQSNFKCLKIKHFIIQQYSNVLDLHNYIRCELLTEIWKQFTLYTVQLMSLMC